MDKICELGVIKLVKMLRDGKITSEEVTEAYLNRIDEAREINAILTVDRETALKQARKADEKLKNGESGKLLGVPIVIKDNICTKDYKTTCASKFLQDFKPFYDATVVEKLRAEGAIILAKSNMDEFAMGGSGENSAFGKTLNPYDKNRVTGGSSSGSAAAVAAKMCPASLGSDTGGSIRQPASFCGLVGLKPTYGRVSRFGLVAFGSSLDQIGPFAKNVEDASYLYEIIAGYDDKDGTSIDKKVIGLNKKFDVNGLKIGIVKEIYDMPINPEIMSKVDNTISFYRENGAEIVKVSVPNIDKALADYYILSSAEAASNLARFDGIKYTKRAKDYDGIVDLYYKSRTQGFGSEVKRRIMIGNYVLSAGFYDAYYKKALDVREVIRNEFYEAFKGCDVIICPTCPTVAFKFGAFSSPLELYMADILTVPASICGLPALSMPVGKNSEGMPVGVQLIGNMWQEDKLFNIAYFYEKNHGEVK